MKTRLHPIPMAVQMTRLKKAYPDSKASLKRDVLRWVADLTPTPLSRTYRVKLEMHRDGTPKVRLVHPTLQTRDGKSCPHLYPGGVLCLYLPGAFEWTREMQLVETVVPWISEWLAHYEVWLATGEWTGGGEHPGSKENTHGKTEPTRQRKPGDSKGATPLCRVADDASPLAIETNSEAASDFLDHRRPVPAPSESEAHSA